MLKHLPVKANIRSQFNSFFFFNKWLFLLHNAIGCFVLFFSLFYNHFAKQSKERPFVSKKNSNKWTKFLSHFLYLLFSGIFSDECNKKKNHNTVKPEWKFSSPFTNAVGVFYAKMKSWTWWYNLVQYREHLWFISALAKSLSKIHLHNAQTVRDFPISLGFSPLLVLLNCS